MTEMAPEWPLPPNRAEAKQLELRRGLIAELLRTVAHRPDVGPDARRVIIEIAVAVAATPGVDGTCRACGALLPPQYRGRPREYCSDRCRWRQAHYAKHSAKTEY